MSHPEETDTEDLDALLESLGGINSIPSGPAKVEVLPSDDDAEMSEGEMLEAQMLASRIDDELSIDGASSDGASSDGPTIADEVAAHAEDGGGDPPIDDPPSDDPPSDDPPIGGTDVIGDPPVGLESKHVDPRLDRAIGCIVGAALASAVALPCHMRDPYVMQTALEADPAAYDYPSGRSHKGYPADDWAGTIDHMIVLLRTEPSATREKFVRSFAAGLTAWSSQGLAELGDSLGFSEDTITSKAIKTSGFGARLRAPRENLHFAPGAPMVRAIAATRFPDETAVEQVVEWTTELTHSDPRVTGGAQFVALLLRRMLDEPALKGSHMSAPLAAIAKKYPPQEGAAFRSALFNTGTLGQIDFGSNPAGSISTAKIAVWAFRQLLRTPAANRTPEMYKDIVRAVALKGGNATVNAAVVGAILGASLGLARLPTEWLGGLPNRGWLIDLAASAVHPEEPGH